MTPTQRSLKYLRALGYTVAITEHWNPFAKIRQDLFGFIDLLAVNGEDTLAVQTTSLSNMSTRVKKILSNPITATLLATGWSISVHGWKKGLKGDPKVITLRDDDLKNFTNTER